MVQKLSSWSSKKSSTADNYDLIIGPMLLPSQVLLFFHVGEQKLVSWCQIGRIWRVINQIKAAVMQISHCNLVEPDLCAVALSWWNKTPFVSFSGRLRNAYSIAFKSRELFIQCGFFWRETMQLVSRKVGFNACQVSLLWCNSFFIVSLWTFQPTFVCLFYSLNLF